MSRRPSRHYVANLDATSTTNLLPRQTSVQAALLRGPTVRPTYSSNSLVSVIIYFVYPAFLLTRTFFRMSPLILHPWVARPPWCHQYQRKYVHFYASCITQPETHLFKKKKIFSLAPSFLCLPTLLLGAPISLPNTMSLTITFTTLIPNVTGRMTGGAQYSPVGVSQILAA